MRVLVPEWGTLDVFASALAVAAFVALERLKAPLIPTLLACAAAGAAWRLAA
jgi:chromate transporter